MRGCGGSGCYVESLFVFGSASAFKRVCCRFLLTVFLGDDSPTGYQFSAEADLHGCKKCGQFVLAGSRFDCHSNLLYLQE